MSGSNLFSLGEKLFQKKEYKSAIPVLWKSIMQHDNDDTRHEFNDEDDALPYTVENAFLMFMQCFARQGQLAEGYIYVAREYIQRGQMEEAKNYIDRAIEVDPAHKEVLHLRRLLKDSSGEKYGYQKAEITAPVRNVQTRGNSGMTPEELHDMGVAYFNQKQFDQAAKHFEQSCIDSNEQIGSACANAVFCRTEVLDWGFNGSQFDLDMERVERLMHVELMTFRRSNSNGKQEWARSTSVHPHMMLGYPLDAKLQRIVDEAYAATDEFRARVKIDETTNKAYVSPLPSDLPYDQQSYREEVVAEMSLLNSKQQQHRIRIGFVSSAIKQTAVMYLGHSILQYVNRTKFEVHIFATTGPDHPQFIQKSTNGFDWRQRVKDNVDFFHDVSHLQHNHIELARFVRQTKLHILIDWDGYARQGARPQGLFALRPAPVQIFHQEFLGTSGATYVDYLISDEITSPPQKDYLYTEKLIYLPNHFFSKGHAVMPEILPPRLQYEKATIPFKIGTGSPQENRCLASYETTSSDVSFVFCNFHKFLKYNPETMRSWLNILSAVPDSILCLLKNPPSGEPNLRQFVDDISPAMNERIHFLEWEDSLVNHQARNRDLCNVVLDTWPYNGHTTTMDALYAGVPVVTRSDGDHMVARVTTSANIVLGILELNGNGALEYESIAIKLAENFSFYTSIREHLIDTCLQTEPMHRFWDVKRYTKDLEEGLEIAFNNYMAGGSSAHIFVGKNNHSTDEAPENRTIPASDEL
eukprot:CAMPEP_0172417610 /NCGR_PEP_ID=MMETSP1064-20121228/4141_1 /TAXON_ID=202472 /ORGANISM="Aulacoseira subarctica , Strain CCAP 1002/5" /LENGTH=752 /DNA_ID=CAMNT_0013156069 /DNA_START=154 /DNA_END=2412 /DNA_ORIENTATION=-